MIINYVAVSKILTVEDLINDPNFNPEDYYGYIYMTTFLNLNKSYIGKKAFFHNVKRKIGKKEAALIEGKGRRPLTEKVKKDSGWKEYYGSEKEVIELSKTEPADKVIRTVLHLCKTKKELSYYELKNLFKYEVLEQPDRYFNGNIAGTYFRKDLNSK
jgi:hypothetical protein